MSSGTLKVTVLFTNQPWKADKGKEVERSKTETKLNSISGEFIELQINCQLHHIYKGFKDHSRAIIATETQVKNA